MSRARRRFVVGYTLAVALGAASLWRNWPAVQRLGWHWYDQYRLVNDLQGGPRALAAGRYGPGDSVDALLAEYPADYVQRTQHYLSFHYRDPSGFGRTWGDAKDGKLAMANVPTYQGRTTLFRIMTEQEIAEMTKEAQLRAIHVYYAPAFASSMALVAWENKYGYK